MKLTLNLASGPNYNRRAVKSGLGLLCLILAGLIGLNALSFYRGLKVNETLEGHVAELDARLSQVRAELGAFTPEDQAAFRKEIVFANEVLLRDSFHWTELLGYLEEAVPKGVSIRSIEPDFKESSLRLSGACLSVKALRTFLDNLVASENFSEAYLLSHTEEKKVDMVRGPHTLVAFSLLVKEAF